MPRLIDLNGNSKRLKISKVALGDIIRRYKSERLKLLPKKLQDDSLSVWICKAKLEEFFESNSKASGVRIYFGVTKDPNFEPGVHNLVFIPTITERRRRKATDADGAEESENQPPEDGDVQEDQTSDQDWVMSTQSMEDKTYCFQCPPPRNRCFGSDFIEQNV